MNFTILLGKKLPFFDLLLHYTLRRAVMRRWFVFLAILFLVPPTWIFANPDTRKLLENEKNTIEIFQKNAQAVVYVSNILLARRSLFDHVGTEVPAGAGSGFVWDKLGHIVTNYHVVARASKFMITFHKDKKQYPASIVGVEPRKDIAVLKLQELPVSLVPVTTGNSRGLIVGQKAMALGNPFGLDHSISAGIISALGRKIEGVGGVTIEDMIQTDSSINPGNSGGPLLDSGGHVIGVNTMIFSRSGTSAGVGFAVPVDTVKRIVPQIIKHGEVIRPGLGVVLLEEYYRDYFDIKEGVIVKYVDPKGSAYAAGMRGITKDKQRRYYLGDVILSIDGQKVTNYDDIYHILDKKKVGDMVTVKVRRGDEKGAKDIRTKLVRL